jgi:hypothetical protein
VIAAEPTENPLESLCTAVATDVRDWSLGRRDAWIYGIVCGWDEAIGEVAARHGWTAEDVQRLKRLHKQYNWLRNAEYSP